MNITPRHTKLIELAQHDQRYLALLPAELRPLVHFKGTKPKPKLAQALQPLHSLPCIHEGNILEWCHSCPATAETKHVRECDIYGKCTRGFVSDKVKACARCDDYATEEATYAPQQIHNIFSDPGRRFNCSLLRFGDKNLLAYRDSYTNSKISIVELDTQWRVVNNILITLKHPSATMGQEDPRLFVFHSKLHVMFSGLLWLRGKMQVSILFAELNNKLETVRVWEPKYAKRTYPMEKSWSPFEYEGELYIVYSVAPLHQVLHIDTYTSKAELVYSTHTHSIWTGGHLRGGAAPVLVGDEYYHWFHGHKSKQIRNITWYDYSVGLYTFEAKPPFAIKRMARNPVWVGDTTKTHLNIVDNKNVIYPCGAMLNGKQWYISAGHQDAQCLIGVFDVYDVDRQLESI